MNLFMSTKSLTAGEENHLTEFIASTLEVDQEFRQAYTAVVLETYANRQGWQATEISHIETQKSYPGSSCRPDLVLTLQDGHVVACEHKIEASETWGGKEADSDEPIRQLRRYLQLPVDGVAYFRSSWNPPAAEILTHPKYVKPDGREHFLWSDLYEALQKGSTDLSRWLREGFEQLGYTPPHPTIGDLLDPDDVTRRANRQNLAKLWQLTRSSLREGGWKVEAGSVFQLYLRQNARSIAELIWISPRSEVLLIRVTPRDPIALTEIRQRVSAVAPSLQAPIDVSLTSVPRGDGLRDVVDVTVPLAMLLKDSMTPLEVEKRLASYVLPIVRAVDRG